MKTTSLTTQTPELIIPEEIYNTLLNQVNSTNLEITMILSIEKIKTLKYKVINVYLPPQWNEGAETKTIDAKYPQWCFNKIKQGIKLNGHMHTHPAFSVTPSGYDNNFLQELIKDTTSFQFRFILNQHGFIQADLIDKEDTHMLYESINIIVPCEGFNLVINNNSINLKVTNESKINISKINEDFTVNLLSKYISYIKGEIYYQQIDKKLLIKTQSRIQAGEGPKITYTYPQYLGNSLFPDEEEDDPWSLEAQKY